MAAKPIVWLKMEDVCKVQIIKVYKPGPKLYIFLNFYFKFWFSLILKNKNIKYITILIS